MHVQSPRCFIKLPYRSLISNLPQCDGVEGLGSSTKSNFFPKNCIKYPDMHRKTMFSFLEICFYTQISTWFYVHMWIFHVIWYLTPAPPHGVGIEKMSFYTSWHFIQFLGKDFFLEIESPRVWVGVGDIKYQKHLFARNCMKYPDLHINIMY